MTDDKNDLDKSVHNLQLAKVEDREEQNIPIFSLFLHDKRENLLFFCIFATSGGSVLEVSYPFKVTFAVCIYLMLLKPIQATGESSKAVSITI